MEINLYHLPCDLFFGQTTFAFFDAIDTDAVEEMLRAKDLTEENLVGQKKQKHRVYFPPEGFSATPY